MAATLCAIPGNDGPNTAASGSVNSYFPGAASASAGATSISVGAINTSGLTTPIAIGDLVLIIQMQDASINSSNSVAYGDGSTGSGVTSWGQTGYYEYAVATSAVTSAGGTLGIKANGTGGGLVNSYVQAAATGTKGQSRFQVVRVPQYSAMTISGTVTAPRWNGTSGGIVVIEVAGTLTFSGGTINVAGYGFRGGAGRALAGAGGSGLTNTDYVSLATLAANGAKGEGAAGTPRYVYDAGSAANVDTGVEGYPNGSQARGAPGNAGGGGTDGNPVNANDQNSGGGGGSNGGPGGLGGNTWSSNLPRGGLGGSTAPNAVNRLFMGGGGGAGSRNNSSGTASAGGAGGGIVLIRAGAIAGSGTINVNGAAGGTAANDAGGGGGAGGTVLVYSPTGVGGLSISAVGGVGGSNNGADGTTSGGGGNHGPGGGGGGGYVITAGSPGTLTNSAGAQGSTVTSGTSYGSSSGTGGSQILSITPTQIPGVTQSGSCVPNITVTKTVNPTSVVNSAAGTSATYSVTIANASTLGTAQNVKLSDTLPTGFTYASGATVTLTGGASGTSPPANTGSTTVPVLGNYALPGGGQIVLTFPVAIASSVAPGTYPNIGHGRYDDPARTAAGAQVDVASAAANLTVYYAPAGIVYNEANRNDAQDNNETSTGITGLYVKMAPVTGGVCTAPALASAAVDPTTGTYAVTTAVPAGDYCLILDNNNTLSDITPSTPTGWVGTEAASGIRRITVGAFVLPPQNFGLYNGSSIAGRVFGDTGTGGGTANDGTQNGGEAGLSGITVTVSSGATVLATATTDASGNYVAYLPVTASGSLTVTETLPAGYVATGGNAGTTGGNYVRATNTTTFTYAGGQSYTGVNFANALPNTFAPDGVQSAPAGTAVYYPHTFTPGSGGKVTFNSTAQSSPATPVWTETIYQDSNCNGKIDAGETILTPTTSVTATAGTPICIVVREFVPANATQGMQDKVTVNALFIYTYPTDPSPGAAPTSTLTRTDTTTVVSQDELALTKQVRNITTGTALATSNSASPSDVVEYQLTFTNQGTQALANIVVNDATPAYTTWVSAACPATIPAASGLTSCTIATQPAVGATGSVQWTFAGSLNPGTPLSVTFRVKVNP